MDSQTLLSSVFTPGVFQGAKAFVLCRETSPEVLHQWVEALKRAGMYTKSAQDLMPGQDWELQIQTWMEESDFVVALFDGKSATETGWFQKFVRIASRIDDTRPEGQILLIPVRLDEGALRSGFKFIWLDVWDPDAPRKLTESIMLTLAQRG